MEKRYTLEEETIGRAPGSFGRGHVPIQKRYEHSDYGPDSRDSGFLGPGIQDDRVIEGLTAAQIDRVLVLLHRAFEAGRRARTREMALMLEGRDLP